MNKKGFTLVELLAVIIILSLLALVASTTITKIVKNSKTELYNAQIELIKVAAQTWGEENIDKLPNDGECKYLTLKNLKTYGILEESIINPQTNKEFSDKMNIKITSTLTDYGNLNFKYEVDSIDVSECTPTYPLCLLVSDADSSNTITPGDKYLCRVKDVMEKGFESGYYFYVLSNDNSGTINLLMDRNIHYDNVNNIGVASTETNKGLVSWNKSIQNHSFGPITALEYLHNATKDWNNVPNIKMDYDDENAQSNGQKGTNGYNKIITIKNVTFIRNKDGVDTLKVENLKARMPKYNELFTLGCSTDVSGSCPLWLVNYLDNDAAYPIEDGKVNVAGIRGYWTLSSYTYSQQNAWRIHNGGKVGGDQVTVMTNGVRPVITIPKSELE